MASDAPIAERLTAQAVEQTLQERNCTNLRFYDAETHTHMFALPRYLRDLLNDPDYATALRDALRLDVQ